MSDKITLDLENENSVKLALAAEMFGQLDTEKQDGFLEILEKMVKAQEDAA